MSLRYSLVLEVLPTQFLVASTATDVHLFIWKLLLPLWELLLKANRQTFWDNEKLTILRFLYVFLMDICDY